MVNLMKLTVLRCRWRPRNRPGIKRRICLRRRRWSSVCTKRVFEDNTLVVSLALALRLDAIPTRRSFLATFYSPSTTSYMVRSVRNAHCSFKQTYLGTLSLFSSSTDEPARILFRKLRPPHDGHHPWQVGITHCDCSTKRSTYWSLEQVPAQRPVKTLDCQCRAPDRKDQRYPDRDGSYVLVW